MKHANKNEVHNYQTTPQFLPMYTMPDLQQKILIIYLVMIENLGSQRHRSEAKWACTEQNEP